MILNYRTTISSGSSLIRAARASAVLGLAIVLLPQRSVTFEAHPSTFVEALPTAPPQERVIVTAQRPLPIVEVAAAQAAAPTPQQPSLSGLTGAVRDSSGAPIPGVTVSLIRATGIRQAVITNREGEFSFPQIEPGPYTIEASLPGFAGYQGNLALQPGTPFRQDITLQVAARAGTVGGIVGEVKLILAPVEGRSPSVQAQTANLSGAISDQSGARVPGVTVRLSPAGGGAPQSVVSNNTGAYQFSQINPGQYTLSGGLPGFQTFTRTIVVRSGNTNLEDVILHVARAITTVEVSVSAPQVTAPPPTPTPPVRIGGVIAAPNLLSQVKPQYPAAARAQVIQGAVHLLGIVDVSGQVVSLQLDPSQGGGNMALVQAAMEAARQWRYRPATLNGQPIEFPTTITVNFTFQ